MKLLPPALQPPLMRYAIDRPGTFFAEAIRSVRLAIQRTMRTQPVKVILVSSSLDSEGKTTLAGNLAQSLATLGIRTLLIDGDLRNPQMTRALCPRADLGLLEVALGRCTAEQAILTDRSTGLSILPSTTVKQVEIITELMFSERIVDVLDHLRRQYELIIIDSPPLVPLVDGRALAELADRIILALAWDQTPGEVLTHTMGLLSPVSDRILGNGADPGRSQPPAVLRLLPQLGLSQAVRRGEPQSRSCQVMARPLRQPASAVLRRPACTGVRRRLRRRAR